MRNSPTSNTLDGRGTTIRWRLLQRATAVMLFVVVLALPGGGGALAHLAHGGGAADCLFSDQAPRAAHSAEAAPSVSTPRVLDTLVLYNDSLERGNYLPRNGLAPVAVAYDGGTSELFVALTASNAVAVISDATDRVVAFIPVGLAPGALVYDSGQHEIFVADGRSNLVTVISDTNDTVAASIHVGLVPGALAYDSGRGEIFVANTGDSSVSVISDTRDAVVATIALRGEPGGLAYAEGQGEVYVSTVAARLSYYGFHHFFYRYWSNVTAISDVTNAVAAKIPLGARADPVGVAFDSGRNEIYVAESGESQVKVISARHAVVATAAVGSGPRQLAYDAPRGEVYVTNALSDNVSVLNDTRRMSVASLPLGASPSGVAYDAGQSDAFVALESSNEVRAISDATNTVVADVAVGSEPQAVAYVAGSGKLYVTNARAGDVGVVSVLNPPAVTWIPVGGRPGPEVYDGATRELFIVNGGELSVVATSNDTLVGTVPLHAVAGSVAYDPGTGEIYVTTSPNSEVEVVSDQNDSVVATIPALAPGWWSYAPGAAYDPGQGELFVADIDPSTGAGRVDVISDTTHAVVAHIPVGRSPRDVAYDAETAEIFVTNEGSNNVSVISDATNTVVDTLAAGSGPEAITYDPGTREVIVANYLSNNLTVFSDSTDGLVSTVAAGEGPNRMAYDPTNGSLYLVNELGGTVSVLTDGSPDPYHLTFTESGLPAGATWSVGLNGTTGRAATDTIQFSTRNGSYAYSVTSATALLAYPSSGDVTVSGSNATISIQFSTYRYDVTFAEYGLPPGTSWAVSVNGTPEASNLPRLQFAEPNGSYPFTVSPVTGYRPNPSSGSITVQWGSTLRLITFAEVNPPRYSVTFTELGLPVGTAWAVTLNDSLRTASESAIAFETPNGSYPFLVGPVPGYLASPASDRLNVLGGPVSRAILFTPDAVYSLSVSESGLPPGTPWTVSLDGSPRTSTTTEVVFAAPDGTFRFSVTPVAGFSADPPSGTVVIAGRGLEVSVTFTLHVAVYPLSFVESTLPALTNWSVTLTGTSVATSPWDPTGPVTRWSDGGVTVVFYVPNGTYSYVASAASGPGESGSVTFQGGYSAPISVGFLPAPAGSGPSPLAYEVVGAVVAIGLGLGATLLRRRRRDGRARRRPVPPSDRPSTNSRS